MKRALMFIEEGYGRGKSVFGWSERWAELDYRT